MRREFKLPDVGEGLTEAEIVRWHVSQGDTVKLNQIIVEIETAKAVVELPSPFEGTVSAVLVQDGTTVDVGTPIITIDDGAAEAEAPASASAPASEEKRTPVLVGYGVKAGASKRRPRKAAAAEEVPEEVPEPQVPVARGASAPGVLAKPPVRKLAKDLGVDLASLTGTGPQGTITREDVHGAVAGTTAAPVAEPVPAGADEERIPVKGVRRATAQAMVASAFSAPHVTEFLQVDMTETMDTVRRLRDLPDFADVKVSPLLLVAKALLVGVRRHPMVNSAWDERAQEIVVKRRVNLGIAAATPRGLIVPNVKDAHALSLVDLGKAMQALVETARAGKTQPADMSGGTITITNVGVFGVDAGTPIINPGESAILAFGQIRDLPWVVDGQIVPRRICTLSLSFDHRIIDGELGSRLLRDVGDMLEDPLRTLAWS
ncbi:2-oxo acid dehydrogenase subunit E2 [Spongiactinospora rosea]|uniref:Dihydrolipoamide acetyltransferase component of pyruvate dehydrogenase complex n=1 Tax=Spongiactinospora rosea TaxID=2248750 RepID=A0A366LV87_9ACTN|nr:dihydrolipoamide acetyltransferase family protein [Spongiactinospora rosea]RBQ17868.1 2-oxo acid dehydrogenase subunit E2 [Spongiactinospora rosea]